MPLTRREAIKALGALAALRLDANALTASQRRQAAPNIVFIMTDDQRHDALSSAGNTILRTPNIDRIATEGVRFADAFVTNALCAPSRASILTGLYSHAHGVITNGGGPHYYNQPGLPAEQAAGARRVTRAADRPAPSSQSRHTVDTDPCAFRR